MRKSISALATVAFIAGCATTYKPVPDGYSGTTATIKDSFKTVSGSKVEFFYVEKIDGHDVANSRHQSLDVNRGRGMNMSPVPVERVIPVQPVTLSITARTEYAAPILALTHKVYEVKGNIQFTPDPGKTYVVRGTLGPQNSAVWLEDEASQDIVGQKIVPTGSASLGFFEK